MLEREMKPCMQILLLEKEILCVSYFELGLFTGEDVSQSFDSLLPVLPHEFALT
jgi:hypothetical protein